MIPIYPEAVNLTTRCLTEGDMVSILSKVIGDTITVAQEFAILTLILGVILGFWIGMNWERQQWKEVK